jgi:CDGSH-type Zn-finger protein
MKIKVTKNGPYIISSNIPLYEIKFVLDNDKFPINFTKPEKVTVDETYSLCRCGHSKNKPFCDGTHAKIGFKGDEVSNINVYKQSQQNFETEKLKLIDAPILCDHSRFCTRAGGIRNLMKKGDIESEKIAMNQAQNCPSGRLTLIDKKTKKSCEPGYNKEIVLIYDTGKDTQGPIWVRGGIPIESAQSEEYEIRNRMTLCRCGKSENKPFCDGSHWADEEFQSKFRKKWDLD